MTATLKHRAVAGAKWMSISHAILFGVQLIQMGVLARFLEPKDFGLMALIWVVISIIQGFADLGLGNSLISRKDVSQEHFSLVYWIGLGSGILLFGALMVGSGAISQFFHEPDLQPLLRWIALTFLIIPLAYPFQIILQKQLRFKNIALCEMMGSFTSLVISITLAYGGKGIFALVFGYISLVVVRSTAIIMFRSREYFPTFKIKLKETRSLFAYGGFQISERFVITLNGQMDKMMLGKLMGTNTLGYYSLAHQFVLRPVMLFNQVLNRVGFPLLSDIQADKQKVRQIYFEMIKFISFWMMPLYLGLYCIAEPLFTLWLGPGWGSTIEIFKVLVFLGIFVALGNPIGSLVLALGRPGINFAINLYVIGVNIIAIWVGSQWGVMGITWGVLLAMTFALFPIDYFILGRMIKMSAYDFTRAWLPSLLMAFVMAGSIHLVRWGLNPASHILDLVCSLMTGVISYIILVFCFQKKYVEYVWHLLKSNK